jgi:ATPase subunit of ABC transporter with duplicated ATPase domains
VVETPIISEEPWGKMLFRRSEDHGRTRRTYRVIYSIVGVGKVHGTKQVLKDIYLGYFCGAKIGVIGLNGSGKTSLLKIMAGVDTAYLGEVARAPGYSAGYLEQEPKLSEREMLPAARETGASVPARAREIPTPPP